MKTLKLHIGLIISIGLLGSCHQINQDEKGTDLKKDHEKTSAKLSIIIQPFEGIPKPTVDFVAARLKEIYSGPVIINDAIPLPQNTLNRTKKRYRADLLIRHLGSVATKDQVIIGLTNKDISITKGKKSDWGVFGLGYTPGNSCIASTFRLKGENRLEKLYKVAIHELGHTQGLALTKTRHCQEKTCFMRDYEGKDQLNQLDEFCSKCKPVLISAGWKLL